MDPTRDRGKTAKRNHFGRQPGPSLVISHHGGHSKYLGNHYVSADNQSSRRAKRSRRFLWTPVEASDKQGPSDKQAPDKQPSDGR